MKKSTNLQIAIKTLIITNLFFAIPIINNAQQDSKNIGIFSENKGQWDARVLFKANISDGALFIEKNGFTYNFFNSHDLKNSHAHNESNSSDLGPSNDNKSVHFHAYKVSFENSNENISLDANEQSSDYENYFIGKDQSKWASHVKKYAKVVYNNIYDKTDLKIYNTENGIEYDFILKPGAKYSNIKLKYEGVDNLYVKDNKLHIKTSVNEVVEMIPMAYQEINGEKKQISCSYSLNNNIVSFQINENFNTQFPLIIDPTLIFSTYSGSTVDNWGFTASYDMYGNVFSGGIVYGVGYPVNTGAYQESYAGIWDVGIIKYTPDGVNRIFATYLGGTGCEMPHSLVVNDSKDLLVYGTTGSSDFPVTPEAYDTSFNGGINTIYDNTVTFPNGTDIYVAKISEDGSQMLGCTYVGGSENDGLNYRPYINWNSTVLMHGNDSLYYNYADGARGEIIANHNNSVYVGSCTFSSDFPNTSGIQAGYGGGEEGIVFNLSPDLSELIWSTYLGGSGDDAVYSLELDNGENVVVAGGTNSVNFPTTTDSYNTSYNGGTADGFVTKINKNGNSILASTFFGSTTYDQAYFTRCDKNGNIYITGQTTASGSTLIYNALYSLPNSGQFIAKFNNNLDSLEWSTVFGTGSGKPNISISSFSIDLCGRVYVSGWGREWSGSYPYNSGSSWSDYWSLISGTKNMQVTSDAYQSTTDGQDFYIMAMSEDASSLDYATFFGEQYYSSCGYSGHDHVDGGTSRMDRNGNIYQSVCASCGGCQLFPVTSGVWSQTNNATNCNNAVFSLSIADDISTADFDTLGVNYDSLTVQFLNLGVGQSFQWDFNDGTFSTETNPTHKYNQPGVYRVCLSSNDPNSCNLTDSFYRTIDFLTVGNKKKPIDDSFLVYPNPSDGNFFIRLSGYNNNDVGIKIFNIDGKELYNYKLFASGEISVVPIKIVSNGIFIIELQSGEKISRKQIVVSK